MQWKKVFGEYAADTSQGHIRIDGIKENECRDITQRHYREQTAFLLLPYEKNDSGFLRDEEEKENKRNHGIVPQYRHKKKN